ncbi:MAG: O-acetyl-ADP-ribose deacetylase [Deltaproteobacteria bacterium]|nr:O-acetyl-ADP-ribose deacetylase [Deltaproteobacteria bacterium]
MDQNILDSSIMERIEIIQGDITRQNVDAIVNAANNSLLGGGGVDGAIHAAAGPGLLAECRTLGGCPTGEARLTGGYNLPARWVIHTVGPVWRGGTHGEDQALIQCYRHVFALALSQGVVSLALPSISTGAYRFPLGRASRIALTEAIRHLAAQPLPEKVIFVCFDSAAFNGYREAVGELAQC